MAAKEGQTRVDGLEKIDSALDALVKYLKKKPSIYGINILASKVKNEIQLEQRRLKTYMDEQSIRHSDRLKIENLKREFESRKVKVIYLEEQLAKIMTTCRGINKFKSKSQKFTTLEQCKNELTKLKHRNERLTGFVNNMSQSTELYHVKRVVMKRVSEQRGRQQALNHEQWKKTESTNNMMSVNKGIQCFEKELEYRDLQVKELEEDLHERKHKIYHLEGKLKEKDIQLLKTSHRLNEYSETIVSLRRTNLVTTVDIESRDQTIEELKQILHSVRMEMTTANECLRKKIKTQEEQLLKQRDEQQQHASNQVYGFETGQSKTIKSLKQENQEKDDHISKLNYQLKQALNTVDNRNAEIRQINISLNERVRYSEKEGGRARHLEKLLNRQMAEIDGKNERIDFLNTNMRKKESQLHELREQLDRTLEKLREIETESDEIKTTLEQKNQNLIGDIKLRNQHVKDLEEQLDSKRTERGAENEHLAKEKDNEISQRRYQQLLTFKKWQNREAELNKNIMTLERENKQYKKKLKGLYFKMTQSSDRNALLEIELKGKDEQSHQRDHNLEKVKASKDDLLRTITELKKKNIDLEAECGLKEKDLEKLFNRERSQLKDENELLVNRLGEKDKDQKEQLQQVINKFCEREVKMNDIIISLKKEQEDEKHVRLELKDQLKQTLKMLKNKEAEIAEINRKLKGVEAEIDSREQKKKNLHDERETEVTELTKRNEFLEKTLKEMDDRLREQNEELRLKTEHLQKDVEQRDRKVSDLEDVLQRIQEENREDEQYKDVKGKDEKMSQLEEKLEQTLRKLHDAEVELDETKTRLSKAMGDRLTDNNPNITDLSDRNRPTKLAERCAELYDNQWTDAFDVLEKYIDKEENVIEALLLILQDVMTFCERNAQRQMEEFGRELIFGDKHDGKKISADVRKLLKDCRKTVAPFAVGNVQKMYVSHLKRSTDKTSISALEVSSYTSECLDICWFMAIQDPPVAFAPLLNKGSSFDTDLYKPYTSSGTHIEYVVWPALLLHKGGPILSKGVAQGQGMK